MQFYRTKFIDKDKFKYLLIFLFIIIGIFFTQIIIKTNEKRDESLSLIYKHKDFKTTKEFLLSKIKSPFINIDYKVQKGDSIKKILKSNNVNNNDIDKSIKLIKKFSNPNNLHVGKKLNIIIEKDHIKKTNYINKIIVPITKSINIEITRDEQFNLVAKKIVTKLYKKFVLSENIIKNNLYSAAIKAKVEPNIIIEFARIYGFEIDFQRDIRENDRFQIFYEKFFDERGEFVKSGKIIFASMNVNNREVRLYKFGNDKNYGYFNESGKSVEKALMKTPINGARLSSSFGMRKHPISGFNKMHKGTDFAAKTGTPIMASGTGKIVSAKWNGGYGNYIKIKHNSTYSTAYAHLKSFARGIKVGKKIRQGDIIGYVGSTGNSTGPHLHYEVIINGKKVNSQKLKLPSGKVLKGDERKLFEIHRIKTDVLIAEKISQ